MQQKIINLKPLKKILFNKSYLKLGYKKYNLMYYRFISFY
jgi:hypothetical protein